MAGERELAAGREDPDRALRGIVDEDRLGEAEVARDGLATLGRDRGAVEEDAERVAAAAVRADEHAEDVELGHRSVRLRSGSAARAAAARARRAWRPMIVIASVIRPSRDHRQRLVERHPADRELLGRIRATRRRGSTARAANSTPASSLIEFDRWNRTSSRQPSASTPVSSRSSRRAPSSGDSPARDAALGDLPGVRIERVAVLADEQDPVVIVEDDDARGEVREVDDAVDARAAVGPVDLVVPDRDPGVLVRDAPRAAASTGPMRFGALRTRTRARSSAASSHGPGGLGSRPVAGGLSSGA